MRQAANTCGKGSESGKLSSNGSKLGSLPWYSHSRRVTVFTSHDHIQQQHFKLARLGSEDLGEWLLEFKLHGNDIFTIMGSAPRRGLLNGSTGKALIHNDGNRMGGGTWQEALRGSWTRLLLVPRAAIEWRQRDPPGNTPAAGLQSRRPVVAQSPARLRGNSGSAPRLISKAARWQRRAAVSKVV